MGDLNTPMPVKYSEYMDVLLPVRLAGDHGRVFHCFAPALNAKLYESYVASFSAKLDPFSFFIQAWRILRVDLYLLFVTVITEVFKTIIILINDFILS